MPPLTPPIQLVCLDLAGTTVADGGVVERAFVQALLECGMEPGSAALGDAIAHVRASMGRSKGEVFAEVFPDDPVRAASATACFEQAYDASVQRGEVAPIPGAEQVVRTLQAAGVRVCFTTGFPPATRDRLLQAIGWEGLADLVLSPEDAGRGRPSPDMVLTAVLRLGVDDVRRVAVVGDTTNDLVAGTRAGASLVVGVLTGAHDREHLEQVPHTHLLASVDDLPALVLGCHGGQPLR